MGSSTRDTGGSGGRGAGECMDGYLDDNKGNTQLRAGLGTGEGPRGLAVNIWIDSA